MMSTKGEVRLTLVNAARHLWGLGGLRAYYRGLAVRLHGMLSNRALTHLYDTQIGLLGVFPYAHRAHPPAPT
jgi:hypothetical protein